ncbi:hypothetical protein [Nonomuraea jiangxiensis]|uniref:Uncharacterized protein n=1 Tax=Nonomuraea jiangxiensis TaxID=633440 RepID=A0A1G8I802_9ACTN|nr:hypothetical protein [Nonomuraea jiangxiensis]SDI14962.1 hypothetical protein SAMN05421869_104403 [Nonomuraea jiangxiensis]
MATLMDRVRAYLRSPKGRQNIEKAKRMARDPRTQEKARGLLNRWRSRRH